MKDLETVVNDISIDIRNLETVIEAYKIHFRSKNCRDCPYEISPVCILDMTKDLYRWVIKLQSREEILRDYIRCLEQYND